MCRGSGVPGGDGGAGPAGSYTTAQPRPSTRVDTAAGDGGQFDAHPEVALPSGPRLAAGALGEAAYGVRAGHRFGTPAYQDAPALVGLLVFLWWVRS